jgi:tRNA pseudouridine55 synthase
MLARSIFVRGLCTASDQVVMPSGLVAVHKPRDWSSNDVVQKVRNILRCGAGKAAGRRVKLKVGHGGTLDPMAEGVLVLGVGQGTKLMADFLSGGKGYRAQARLGFETDSLDATGSITRVVESSHVTRLLLEEKLPLFRGDIMQVPPMFSALKKDGKRLYELARQGIEVEREARPVTVYDISIRGEVGVVAVDAMSGEGRNANAAANAAAGVSSKSNSDSNLHFHVDMECSGGFYVRTLIEDLARECNAAAHMTALIRTKQGPFLLEDCLAEEQWDYELLVNALRTCTVKAGLVGLKPAIVL